MPAPTRPRPPDATGAASRNPRYEGSQTSKDEEGQPIRGYKLGLLSTLIDVGRLIVQLEWDGVRAADASFLDAVLAGAFTVPGDGGIDFPAVLAELAAADYRGWLVVEAEQDPAVAPPLEYAGRGFQHLNAAVDRAGL